MTKQQLLHQQALARRELAGLRKAFPALFGRDGRPLMAVLRMPGIGGKGETDHG